jgi:hypothetical protein
MKHIGWLEQDVERLYERVQLPSDVAEDVRAVLEAETDRQPQRCDERDFQARRLVKLEEQRRKLW